jgi:hypothetical protein
MKHYYTKEQILENKQLLKEDVIENVLMTIGFVPVIGEIADIVLIIKYLMAGEYLYAGLMLFALIPLVGDFIAKPIIKIIKGSRTVVKNADNLVAFATKNKDFAERYVSLKPYLNSKALSKTVDGIGRYPIVGNKFANKLRNEISEHNLAINRVESLTGISPKRVEDLAKGAYLGGPKNFVKQIGKDESLRVGTKNFYQGKYLANYIAKNGQKPSTWVSNWWNVVRPARKARRDDIKKFIIANGLLDLLGLPSLHDVNNSDEIDKRYKEFSERLQNDKDFRDKLANDPRFGKMVSTYSDPDEIERLNNMGDNNVEQPTDKLSPMSMAAGLKFLKMVSNTII